MNIEKVIEIKINDDYLKEVIKKIFIEILKYEQKN